MALAKLNALDRAASAAIHNMEAPGVIQAIILVPAMTFGYAVVPILVVAAFFVLPGRYVAALVIVDVAKILVGRRRPRHFAPRAFDVRSLVKNHAMPSGDSAQAALWACVLSRATGSYAPFALVPCAMFARVFYGAHWVGDTVVGAAAGFFIEHLCYAALQRWCTPPPGGAPPPRDYACAI